MKRFLVLVLLPLLSSALFAQAATTDFTANGNVIVSSVNGDGTLTSNLTIQSGSSAQSWSYSGGVFTVVYPDPTVGFRVTSSEGAAIRVDNSGGAQVACANNTTPGTSAVSLPMSDDTFSVFPSSASCAGVANPYVSNSGGSSSGYTSGASVAAATAAPQIEATTTVSVPTAPSGCSAGNLFNTLTGAPCAVTATNPTATTTATTLPAFTKNLKFGMSDPQVKLLQQYLNTHGYTVALAGVGSAGHETNYFGAATRAALIKLQKAKSITPAIGYFGPVTRGWVNTH